MRSPGVREAPAIACAVTATVDVRTRLEFSLPCALLLRSRALTLQICHPPERLPFRFLWSSTLLFSGDVAGELPWSHNPVVIHRQVGNARPHPKKVAGQCHFHPQSLF